MGEVAYLPVPVSADQVDVVQHLNAIMTVEPDVRYQVWGFKADDEDLTYMIRVGVRWWTLQNHGDYIELLGLDAVQTRGRVYEFIEPFWEMPVFLPWDAYLASKEEAIAAVAAIFDDERSDRLRFSQRLKDIGVDWEPRHREVPLNRADYDALPQRDWT